MYYDELVRRLRTMVDWAGICFLADSENVRYNLSEAADAIEELQQAAAHYEQESKDWYAEACEYKAQIKRWIPVTERLPKEERKTYWICTDNGYQCECRWTNNQYGLGESDTWCWNIFDIPQYQKVIAWMLLPEPPKEGTWK